MTKDQTPTISFDVRLEINGIVDRLAGDGDTFPRDLAERLVRIIPLTTRPSLFQGEFTNMSRGGAVQGVTTTGHAASTDGGEQTRRFAVGSDGAFRVGQWKLAHTPGYVEIGRMMQEAVPRVCLLRYDPATGAAVDMCWPRQWDFGIGRGRVVLRFGWRLWKSPVPSRDGP